MLRATAFPATDTISMRVGETLKVRFIGSNNGFIHPMHIHGGPFEVVAVDGQTLPHSARYQADTINVGPGSVSMLSGPPDSQVDGFCTATSRTT